LEQNSSNPGFFHFKIADMFLMLNHQKLDAYKISRSFVSECYRITRNFPNEEKFGLISQIRRAAVSVHLNIAEGASRKSTEERKRYYEVARGSLIEVDAAFDVASDLEFLKNCSTDQLGILTVNCFKVLTGLLK
jgi:four helix bundle protein